jgi:Asp-tRNAAsn/Glu-tRNAGln amidotransferase B subunit (PET112 homolog)
LETKRTRPEATAELKRENKENKAIPKKPDRLGSLLTRKPDKTNPTKKAKDLFNSMLTKDKTVDEMIKDQELEQINR